MHDLNLELVDLSLYSFELHNHSTHSTNQFPMHLGRQFLASIDILIYLEGDFSAEKAKRAAQLSYDKYCSVSKTLEPTAEIFHKVILNGIEV